MSCVVWNRSPMCLTFRYSEESGAKVCKANIMNCRAMLVAIKQVHSTMVFSRADTNVSFMELAKVCSSNGRWPRALKDAEVTHYQNRMGARLRNLTKHVRAAMAKNNDCVKELFAKQAEAVRETGSASGGRAKRKKD